MKIKLRPSWSYPLVLIGIVSIAPAPAAAASPEVEAAIKTLQKIPADTAKFETYCNILGEMASVPDDDAAKYEPLETQLDAAIEAYGADVAAAWDTVSEIDPETDDGKAVSAAFDSMEGKCP
jgi:hypothetical protein